MVLTMTDMSSDSLPQIAIAKVEVEEGVPYSAERELTPPWFNHPPHLLWGTLLPRSVYRNARRRLERCGVRGV